MKRRMDKKKTPEKKTEPKGARGGKREGSGRPALSEEASGRDSQVSVSLTPHYVAGLDTRRGNKSRSAYLRDLLVEDLKKAGLE